MNQEHNINLEDVKSVYFIGIGGIGMSSLAAYFYEKGCKVSGYDKAHSSVTDMLEQKGILVNYYENIDNIREDTDLIVYTPAITTQNIELDFAMKCGLPVLKRAEVLALICKDKFCIAVAGSHGKTTVTSMIAHILSYCNVPFDAFVGGICKNINSNLYCNKGANVVVVEADEYDRSFMLLNPNIAVITSVDVDHVEIYGSKQEIEKTFVQFAEKTKPNYRLVNEKYKNLIKTDNTYGFKEDSRFKITEYSYDDGFAKVTFSADGKDYEFCRLPVYGQFNVENLCAALSVAKLLKLDFDKVHFALKKYKGVARRFEVKYQDEKCVYIDDYAHHPVQVENLLESIREVFPDRKICAFFQPHLFSRTRHFMDEFAQALSKYDEMYLLDIYPAREQPMEGVTSRELFSRMHVAKGGVIVKDVIPNVVKNSTCDVFVTIGAGNIERLADSVVALLTKNAHDE